MTNLKPEHIDQSWENEEARAAGFMKLTSEGANVVEWNVHLYYARQMQDPRPLVPNPANPDGPRRLMDIHTPEERAAFAAAHPEAWAVAAAERTKALRDG